MNRLFPSDNSEAGKFEDIFWIPEIAAIRTMAMDGAGILDES
jgi:hypothetical protein